MMEHADVRNSLKQTGHFDNVAFQNAYDAGESNWFDLQPFDKPFKEAVESFQRMDANTDVFGRHFHGRAIDPDGDIGPATKATMRLDRCNVPDHIRAEAATALWPHSGCDPKRPGEHSVRINIDTTRASQHVLNYLEEALENVVRMTRELGVHVRFLLNDHEPFNNSEIHVIFDRLAGSTIGMNELPPHSTCEQTLKGWIDIDYTPDMPMFVRLGVHEWTVHGFGYGHIRGGIRNPSLLRGPMTWEGDPGYAEILRDYGPAIAEPEPPFPSPNPPQGGEVKLILDKALPAGTHTIKLSGDGGNDDNWFS